MASYDWGACAGRWQGIFAPAIRKVLRQVHPMMAIDEKAVQLLDFRMYSLLAHLCSRSPVFPKTVPQCKAAVLDIFPEDLASWAINEADEAVAVYNQLKKKAAIRTEFPVEKVHAKICKEVLKDTVPVDCIIYLMAVLDYVTADVLKLSGNYTENCHSSTIMDNDISIAVRADNVLQGLFEPLEKLPSAPEVANFSFYEAVRELVHAERRFEEEMETITRVFVDVFENAQPHIKESEVDIIFHLVRPLYDLAQKLVCDLEDLLIKAELMENTAEIGDMFEDMAVNAEFDDFAMQAEHAAKSIDTLQAVLARPAFRQHLTSIDIDMLQAVEYELPRLLQAPAYHLRHYVDSLEILARALQVTFMESEQHQHAALNSAITALRPLAEKVNATRIPFFKQMENYSRMPRVLSHHNQAIIRKLQSSIEGFEGLDLSTCCNELLKQGQLVVMSDKNRKSRECMVFALDGAVITCKENAAKGFRYRFKDRLNTRSIVPELDKIQGGGTNVYRILLHSPDGRELCFTCGSLSDARAWMEAFVRPANRRFCQRALRDKQAEYESSIPSFKPDPSVYPFSQQDSPDNIRFENETSNTDTTTSSATPQTATLFASRNSTDAETDGGRSAPPVIKGGTLIKLVERLTFPQYADMTYVRHFLTTYRSFTTPEELLDLLMKRFNVPEPAELRKDKVLLRRFYKQYAGPIRLRVVNVLKQWVEKHYYDFEQSPALLKDLLQFVRDTLVKDATMTRAVKGFTRCIKKRREAGSMDSMSGAQNLAPPPPIMVLPRASDEPLHILTIHPVEVARQLTLIESELFRAIRPSELIGKAWSKPGKEKNAPHVVNFAHRFNTVSRWVVRSIVETPNFQERVDVVMFILEVLKELRNLNNFNGMMEIVSALNFSAVKRLQHTFAEISPRKLKTLDDCSRLLSDSKNFQELRVALSTVEPPCVPFFGMFQTDLTFVEDGSPDFLPIDEKAPFVKGQSPPPPSDLINFGKRRMVAKTAGQVQQLQHMPYALEHVPPVREYLIKLPSMSEDPIPFPPPNASKQAIEKFDDAVYSLSLAIEPRDVVDKTMLPQGRRLFSESKLARARRDIALAASSKTMRGRSSSSTSSASQLLGKPRSSTQSSIDSSYSSASPTIDPNDPGSRIRSISQVMGDVGSIPSSPIARDAPPLPARQRHTSTE